LNSARVATRAGRLGYYHQEVKVKVLLKKFASDQSGATAIEYGLIAAGISLAIIALINGIGGKLNTSFTSLNTSLQ
jgi:pilus assembly protein Flp/PilA